MTSLIENRKRHLADLLEAIQRCAYYLDASDRKIPWPLAASFLAAREKDVGVFETLSSINERFAKLQDVLGSAMRHAAELEGEKSDSFLRVLAFYEKAGVVPSVETWQTTRIARNLAAHEYGTDYLKVARHFNTLHELKPFLIEVAANLLARCHETLSVNPASGTFESSPAWRAGN